MTATPASVRQQIAARRPQPVYLILGDDDVEKGALAAEFADLVEEDLRAFNVERMHAGDLNSGDRIADGVAGLMAAARTLPMMADRRVVVVMQAEALLSPKRESEAADRALKQLLDLVEHPEPQTTLVFVTGAGLDKRSKAYKLFERLGAVVECGGVQDLADAERWVRTRVAAAGSRIDPAAARRLAELAGPDVKRLRGEVDRLLLFAMGQPAITLDDVRQLAGAAALQDDWAMANAIEAGQAGEALRQLALVLEAGTPTEMVVGQLGWVVRSKFPAIAPDRVRAALDAVFRTDLALKRSMGEPRPLLERLVVELCGGVRARPAGPRRG